MVAESEVISVDTDSDDDDEVIFVGSRRPTAVIPLDIIIDLSDSLTPSDISIVHTSNRARKRAYHEIASNLPALPALNKSPQKFRHNCAVCLDEVKKPHSTICGHIYCGDCIKNSIKVFKKCPTCNRKLKVSNVHPIYL